MTPSPSSPAASRKRRSDVPVRSITLPAALRGEGDGEGPTVMTVSSTRVPTLVSREGVAREGTRAVPEEMAVAFVYDGGSHAVMMATPADLEDFAVGFSLTEGLIESVDDIVDFEAVEHEAGIELRLWLTGERGVALAARRRHLAGPTGCGLCGIDSLGEAVRVPRMVAGGRTWAAGEVAAAMAALAPGAALNREPRAVHAAGFWLPGEGLVALREDVGRHNALDK